MAAAIGLAMAEASSPLNPLLGKFIGTTIEENLIRAILGFFQNDEEADDSPSSSKVFSDRRRMLI